METDEEKKQQYREEYGGAPNMCDEDMQGTRRTAQIHLHDIDYTELELRMLSRMSQVVVLNPGIDIQEEIMKSLGNQLDLYPYILPKQEEEDMLNLHYIETVLKNLVHMVNPAKLLKGIEEDYRRESYGNARKRSYGTRPTPKHHSAKKQWKMRGKTKRK